MADDAEQLATYLEAAASRGDAVRRLRIAAVEREIARIQRRNAARIRRAGSGPVQLEPLPRLPRFEAPSKDAAGETPPDEAE